MSETVIVIGSGPAGVSAAWPLVEAGCDVTMIDAGAPLPPVPADRPPLAAMRRLGESRWLLGAGLEHARFVGDASPKLRTAAGRDFTAGYLAAHRIETRGFRAIGTLTTGGLSAVWGAVACALDGEALAAWPAEAAAALPASYRRVAERIGVSGDEADARRLGLAAGLPLQPPLPLSATAALLAARGRATPDFALGRPVAAVLTRDREGRGACVLCRGCMWGCPTGAVWSSADDLPALAGRANFRLRSGLTVMRIARAGSDWAVICHGGETLRAPRVVLAAGPLGSTRLALAASGRTGQWLPFANTPALGFALVVPSRLGRPLPERGYGNAQLAFRAGQGFGMVYDGDVMAAADLMARMPLSRPGAAALTRALAPALMLGLLYLPGSLSANRLKVEAGDGDPRLIIEGGTAAGLPAIRRAAVQAMAAGFRRLGAWLLPGSAASLEPGAEVHAGASLPIGRDTGLLGEMEGCPGLHLVDAAVLPVVTVEHHTLTVMANADRVGQALARHLTNG
jgi:choline dehydrogenase-like flavoprotein